MSTVSSTQPRALLWYFILAFLISWGLIVVLAGGAGLPIDPEASADILPILYVSMLFGPAVSSLVLTGIFDGRDAYRRLFSRLFHWRVGVSWYALALFTTPILALMILGLLSMVTDEFNIVAHLSEVEWSGVLIGAMTGLFVGLFEELGWSGFAIPRMLRRHSMLATGVLIGLIWGGWHFILFWEADSFSAALPLALLLGRLFAWLPPFRVFMVWLLVRTKSMLLVILAHMSLVFTTTVLVPMSLGGLALLAWLLCWGVAWWLLVLTIGKAPFQKNEAFIPELD